MLWWRLTGGEVREGLYEENQGPRRVYVDRKWGSGLQGAAADHFTRQGMSLATMVTLEFKERQAGCDKVHGDPRPMYEEGGLGNAGLN